MVSFTGTGEFPLETLPCPAFLHPHHGSAFNTEPWGPLRESASLLPQVLCGLWEPWEPQLQPLHWPPGPTWWNAWGFLDSTPPTSPPSIYQPPGLLTDLLTYQTHTLSKAPKDFLLAPNSLSQTYTWLPLAPPSGLCSTFSKHSIWPFLKGQPGLSCALPSLLIWIWYFPSKF